MKDKFSAIWVSHSSISMYLKCPRAYYLANVYRDPKTNHKISLVQPPLSLGQAVHDVIESLSVLPVAERFNESLLSLYDKAWAQRSGKMGGFRDQDTEDRFKERGRQMIQRVIDNPGVLKNKAIKIPQELPYFWLSESDNIILCGKVDWLEYLPETDSVHIIDFKTGKYDEDPDSLQLPIYYLLVKNCQRRPVSRVSYWYLDRNPLLSEMPLPDEFTAFDRVLSVAQKISVARKLEQFSCTKKEGCMSCLPFEKVLKGEAEFVGSDEYNRDLYVVSYEAPSEESDKEPFPNYDEIPF